MFRIKYLLFYLLMLLTLTSNAYNGETVIEGIKYYIATKAQQAEVRASSDKQYSGDIVIPSTILFDGIECNVTVIGDDAFLGCENLTSVNLPFSITTIGKNSFYGCTRLNNIVLPSSLETINDFAFKNCKKLTHISIPSSLKFLGSSVFQGCDNLKVVSISNLAAWCNIDFKDSSSNPCALLHHYYLNEEEIKSELVIPDSVSVVKKYAFMGCHEISRLYLPASITQIDGAFRDCTNLKELHIKSIESWCKMSFSVSGEAYNNPLSYAHRLFIDNQEITDIVIPPSISEIGDGVFKECSNLTSVFIPDNVKEIGSYAFSGCKKLSTIKMSWGIPINDEAFANCPEIKDIFCYENENVSYPTKMGSNIFKESYAEYATLHVPQDKINYCNNNVPWSGFGKIVAINPEDIQRCAKPIISYVKGQLNFLCETEGVEFQSSIKNKDVKEYKSSVINLTATYNISVYATKKGYNNSEVATATLCWIDVEPMAEGTKEAEDNLTEVKAMPILIQSNGGTLNISGTPEGVDINVYDISGRLISSATTNSGTTSLNIFATDSVALVKIGDKVVKVSM